MTIVIVILMIVFLISLVYIKYKLLQISIKPLALSYKQADKAEKRSSLPAEENDLRPTLCDKCHLLLVYDPLFL